jgi:hypothetical protein
MMAGMKQSRHPVHSCLAAPITATSSPGSCRCHIGGVGGRLGGSWLNLQGPEEHVEAPQASCTRV